HQRNYETSLVNALLGKFPATDWLVGPGFLTQTAREFIRIRPPSVPCIAEYGADFPGFLQTRPLAGRVPYIRSLAELEWFLGHVAIAADRPALSPDDVSAVDPDALCNARFAIQDGIRYLAVSSPVDELMKLYLADKAPDQFHMSPGDLWLEVRGSRGAFQINRLENGEFEFRKAIKEGRTA